MDNHKRNSLQMVMLLSFKKTWIVVISILLMAVDCKQSFGKAWGKILPNSKILYCTGLQLDFAADFYLIHLFATSLKNAYETIYSSLMVYFFLSCDFFFVLKKKSQKL